MKKSLTQLIRLTALFVIILTVSINQVYPCSTFMLNKKNTLMVGHNLDKRKHAHGVVVVNKRGVNKQGKSWTELAYNKHVTNPSFEWTSKYGSITFNRFCRDFPDGGMNEAGLFIEEMSLAGTDFPKDPAKPLIFMCLWMQYCLDNFDTIEQVVRSAHDFTIEGWSWHFFTADRNGNAAVIEFLNEKVVVFKGDDLPVPVLGNNKYSEELTRLKTYQGFGGEKIVDLNNKKQPAFVQGAHMLKAFNPLKHSLKEYGFKTLDVLGWSGTQWSCVYDLKTLRIYFKTKPSPTIKILDFAAFDFSCKTPVKMLNIHAFFEGPVERFFQDYSLEYNLSCVKNTFIVSNYEPVFTKNGCSLKQAASNFGGYSELTKCNSSNPSPPPIVCLKLSEFPGY